MCRLNLRPSTLKRTPITWRAHHRSHKALRNSISTVCSEQEIDFLGFFATTDFSEQVVVLAGELQIGHDGLSVGADAAYARGRDPIWSG